MKKAFNLIGTFAAIFICTQIFTYFEMNGYTWNKSDFIDLLLWSFGVMIAYSALVFLFLSIKKPSSKSKEPDSDERTEKMHFKFTGFLFIISNGILLIGSMLIKFTGQSAIPIDYITFFAFIVLFINLFLAPIVIKKL
ncbi:hypothetical protein ACU3L3_13140 [Priestia endophytica]|jgi:hypothetical protein|uniref:Uncharacterized protein n=1 Tax=Priestia endophytica DSM 13796 TaxID=1121089 RepID=A0A1I6BDB2_9BACI|nr:hypothetical protein [Priestia endophytica]KYG26218.1 hypothetical protein AZF06_16965 [Priestia endophytica]SFQ78955.1 hypothetical protein SAMN02745910_03494 [Priestia endophytica DSM 13796]